MDLPVPDDPRLQAWSAYWASGALHSLPTTFPGNYGGEFRAFWLRVFGVLAPGARIVDIATGNGALPELLLQTGHLDRARVDAIDIADIAPGWWLKSSHPHRAHIRFLKGVSAEDLPFSNATFELCVSHYGIEYSRLDQSAPEAVRVTRPDGVMGWLLHHRDSLPVRTAKEDLAHCRWLLSDAGPFACARAVAGLAVQAGSETSRRALQRSAEAEAQRQAFNLAMRRLSERASHGAATATLHRCATAIMQVLQRAPSLGESQALSELMAIYKSLEHGAHRDEDLIAHAPSPADIDDLTALVATLRPAWHIAVHPLFSNGELMGQTFLAGPPTSVARLR